MKTIQLILFIVISATAIKKTVADIVFMRSAEKKEISEKAIEIDENNYYYSLYASKVSISKYHKTKKDKYLSNAVKYLKIASKYPTDKADIYGILYHLCVIAKDIKCAGEFVDKAIKLLPNNYVLEYYKGVNEYNKGNLFNAKYWIESSLEIGRMKGATELLQKIKDGLK